MSHPLKPVIITKGVTLVFGGDNILDKAIKTRLAAICLILALILPACPACAAASAAPQAEVVIEGGRIPSVREFINDMRGNSALRSLRLIKTNLKPRHIAEIRGALRGVRVYAEFKWFERWYNTDMTFAATSGNHKPREIRAFLDIMPALERFEMFGCNISLVNMETLMAAYPSISFGWSVPIGKRRVRSDATAFSTLHARNSKRLDEHDFERALVHVPGLLALDLGHNRIRGIGFLRFFPELKVLILADNGITDIESIADYAPRLEYLELFMNDIKDISPLVGLAFLRDLNLCRNDISDPSPLMDMPSLERCWISKNPFGDEWRQRLIAALPGCHFEFDVLSSTDGGWRKGSAHYETIYGMFRSGAYAPFDD